MRWFIAKTPRRKVFSLSCLDNHMLFPSINVPLLCFYSFLFGVGFEVFYDLLWTVRVFLFNKRLVWLTDILATFSAGIFISVIQYNFTEGRFRIYTFLFFALGVFSVRFTFSRILRLIIDKILSFIYLFVFKRKVRFKSFIKTKILIKSASNGFGLLKK